MTHTQALAATEELVRQHKRELFAAAATGDEALRRSVEERAAACQQHTALAAAHSKLAVQLDAAERARAAADSQAAAEAARAATLSESLDRHKQRATKARQQLLARAHSQCAAIEARHDIILSSSGLVCRASVTPVVATCCGCFVPKSAAVVHVLTVLLRDGVQAAAQAAESDRLLARSLAERAELQARYMALGAKLGAIVRGNAATTCRLQQARTCVYAACMYSSGHLRDPSSPLGSSGSIATPSIQ